MDNVEVNEIIQFVTNYLKKEYKELYSNLNYQEDLVSCCLLEIIKNLEKYNPELGKLTTFMVPHIKCGVKNYQCFLLEKKENSLKNYNQIAKAKKQLEYINEEVTIEKLSLLIGFSEGKIYNELKLPEPTELTYDSEIFDAQPSLFPNPEDNYVKKETVEEAMKVVAKLSQKDRAIILEFIEYLSSDNNDDYKNNTAELKQAQARARLIRDAEKKKRDY